MVICRTQVLEIPLDNGPSLRVDLQRQKISAYKDLRDYLKTVCDYRVKGITAQALKSHGCSDLEGYMGVAL
ncbi:hypothetical protein WJX74_001054 [Apatococcus lobatus]|uniref:Uncharacterized protein n=1 Tax=Apatococcus lobatus TaxID=904363 RepID=A0AAW1RE72_9CHLO